MTMCNYQMLSIAPPGSYSFPHYDITDKNSSDASDVFTSLHWLGLLDAAHIWSAPTVICSLMDMGMLVILKLPECLVQSTDGWCLIPPHNDVPALFKVTSIGCWGAAACRSQRQPLQRFGELFTNIQGVFYLIWLLVFIKQIRWPTRVYMGKRVNKREFSVW